MFSVKSHHIVDANVIKVLFNVINGQEVVPVFDPASNTTQYVVV
jgi:hypothetical protein